jgi:divalent metal cation (Fe/Co/Zn/Cd) transporter
VVGCALARKLPARKLKLAVAIIAIFAGLQLIWSGAHTLLVKRAVNVTKIAATTALQARNAN